MLTFIIVSVSFCLEHKAEVVTSLQHQNSLISSCHEGLTQSIQSVAASGHLGKRNEIKEYFIMFIIWVCHVCYQCYLFLYFLNNAKPLPSYMRDISFVWWDNIYKCISIIVNHASWLIPKKLDKCPTEMQPVKVPRQAWKQIGMHLY